MDRISQYTESVPLSLVVITPLAALAIFILTPAHWRIPLTVALAWIWMTLGKMPNLGAVQGLSKMTAGLPFLLVMLACVTDRGPTRQLNPITAVYVFLALIGPFFVIRAPDRTIGLVIAFSWFLLTMSGLMLAKKLVDRATILRVIKALAVAAVIILLIFLSSLLLDRAASFSRLRRFGPYASNPNQIGVSLILAYTICVACAVTVRSVPTRLLMGFMAFLAFGMGLLTTSRSVVGPMILVLVPVALMLSRQPIVIGLLMLSGIPAIFYIMDFAEGRFMSGRLTSTETPRPEIWAGYLGIIADQPFMGILENPRNGSFASEEVGTHAHNAYLHALYYGGLPYGLLMIGISLISLGSTLHVYFRRKSVAMEPLAVSMLCVLLIIIFGHGFVNYTMWYATYFWAFIHITLSATMLTWSADLRAMRPPLIATQPLQSWPTAGIAQPGYGYAYPTR